MPITIRPRNAQRLRSEPTRHPHGKHRAPSVADACERRFHLEETGVSLKRDVVLKQVPEVNPW